MIRGGAATESWYRKKTAKGSERSRRDRVVQLAPAAEQLDCDSRADWEASIGPPFASSRLDETTVRTFRIRRPAVATGAISDRASSLGSERILLEMPCTTALLTDETQAGNTANGHSLPDPPGRVAGGHMTRNGARLTTHARRRSARSSLGVEVAAAW
jgi:hypothetical protein